MVRQFALEEPLLTSSAAEDKLFPVVFDCAIYPWVEVKAVSGRDICVLDKAKEKKSGPWWRLGAFSLVVGVVVGGLILWRRRNCCVCCQSRSICVCVFSVKSHFISTTDSTGDKTNTTQRLHLHILAPIRSGLHIQIVRVDSQIHQLRDGLATHGTTVRL